MKYIIMCGGNYKHWEKPRHLSIVNGEELVARTIRLLKENGIKDINISSNNPIFKKFNVPVLKHDNVYSCKWHTVEEGDWFNCFYPTDEPVCYIFGDVYFSDEAIKIIVETETDDIEFFGSKPPFTRNYIKDHEEPFALKVVNTKHLKEAIKKTRKLDKENKFWRKPIMWELWTVIKDTPLQVNPGEYPADYIVINDYTCDIDWEEDITKIEKILKGGDKMVKVEVIKEFTLSKFNELKNIERVNLKEEGHLYIGDTFECTEEMAKYLSNEKNSIYPTDKDEKNNPANKVFIKTIEVIPEKVEAKIENKLETKKNTTIMKKTATTKSTVTKKAIKTVAKKK